VPTPPFRYLRDPLFLFCLAAYFVNRYAIKPHVHGGFAHTSLNDLICMPFWIPIMLFGMRRLRLRSHDAPPTLAEILIPLFCWSYLFEIRLPQMHLGRVHATGDPSDVLCYTIGALIASLFW
jgi:hypothetical protein